MTLPELLRKLDRYILWNRMRLYVVAVATLQWPLASVASAQKWWSTINCPWQTAGAGYGQHTARTFCTQPDLRNFGPSHAGEVQECCTILPNGGCGEAAHFLKSLSSPSLAALFNWFHWFKLISTVNTSSSQLFSILLNSFQLFSPLNSCQLSPILPSSPHLAFAALVSSCHLFTIFSNSSHLVSTSLDSSHLISPLLDSSHLFLPLLAISSSYDYHRYHVGKKQARPKQPMHYTSLCHWEGPSFRRSDADACAEDLVERRCKALPKIIEIKVQEYARIIKNPKNKSPGHLS